MSRSYVFVSNTRIHMSHLDVLPEEVEKAIMLTNENIYHIGAETAKMTIDLFEVLDFRVLSGMIGEAFVSSMEKVLQERLRRNPIIDGYPDLLQNANQEMMDYLQSAGRGDLLDYKYGGIEVKNTFGTKRSGAPILMGDQRIHYINRKLDWKAHHQKTNHLLALFSDFYNEKPTIVAAFYSDELTPDDWQEVQRPAKGSAMTSFTTIKQSGCAKLRKGMILCLNSQEYLSYFGVEEGLL